jgi:hypothetical protein
MSKADDGGAAFPTDGAYRGYVEGMSLRDWFAGQALAGLLACKRFRPFMSDGAEINTELIASNCYEIADGLIAQRSKPLPVRTCDLCGKPMGDEHGRFHARCADQEQLLASQGK